MNGEKFRAFANLIETNPAVREELNGITSIHDTVEVLKRHGLEITEEEFAEFVKASDADEISEEMLEFVAGGGKFWNWWQGFKDGLYDGVKGLGDTLGSLIGIGRK